MCIILPEFIADSTFIVDKDISTYKKNIRKLTYVNKIDTNNNKNSPLLMLFHISGKIIQVEEETTKFVEKYKHKIISKFENYEVKSKFQLDYCNYTEFIDEKYHVSCSTVENFKNVYYEILKKMKYDDEYILNIFEKQCLPSVLDKNSHDGIDDSDCYVAICTLFPKTQLDRDETVLSFIYEPQTDNIIVPIMHELSYNNLYEYKVYCYIDNIKMYSMNNIYKFMENFNHYKQNNIKSIISDNDIKINIRLDKYDTHCIGFIYEDNTLFVKLIGNSKYNYNFVFPIFKINDLLQSSVIFKS
ncbi:p35 apoptosis inhibitor [Adoxophyes honmai entomopoxvirus 'L']|uniref:P35 apoptosis inhibitor n=1 Tax=Adoxophyes honmai entomopoxvirus 'L' TaxID=1293540 RepID=A0A916KP75_9POXV|nr:p35 apoptosis inhibitor [Adoxophyes honmai entomopoxvirus 'L']CCU55518.1 p35 apoptosis inhibitor [Adoxophyes honmai entomopoxvirus 'L']